MPRKISQKTDKLTLDSVQTMFTFFETRILNEIKDYMFEQKSDIASIKDEIMTELKTIREEQTILNGRSAKINDIEDKVEKLEEIHPHGQHIAS